MTAGSCGEDLDLVPCLKSATWPKIASEWIQRKRKYGWPSQEIINDMESQGCHLVPTSAITELCNFINTEDITMNNKMRYLMEKVNLELLLSGCRADLSSGKTILASWLYEKNKFKGCLLVTDMALQCIQYRVFHADMISNTLHSSQEILHYISWSFLFRNLHMFYTVQSNFMLRSKLLAKDVSRVLAGFMNLASWD
ncbi:unnamed protein product [Mytilus edulis]|uniref:Mab-21-like nucleotidyltransferase domain-containing protein n=1 Tax=Mytilus edulis TaxID=6550 RepID=A0A8S3UCJ2_MYTED|nr:unnamed protein product [Mytilus edulis]